MKQHFSFGMTGKFIKINYQMMMEANGCLDIYETYDDFKEFVTDYYEIDFDENLLEKLYTEGKLDENELSKLIGG